jgi:hypothetical protein
MTIEDPTDEMIFRCPLSRHVTRGAFDEEVGPEATEHPAKSNGQGGGIHRPGRDFEGYDQFEATLRDSSGKEENIIQKKMIEKSRNRQRSSRTTTLHLSMLGY